MPVRGAQVDPKDPNAVEQALNRKIISDNYHTAVPKFLRSQGPFAVYDHSAHKGTRSHEMTGAVNEQALGRFNSEIDKVQRQREHEQQQFYSTIERLNYLELLKQQDRKRQNNDNFASLKQQIADKSLRKEHEKMIETKYYKPHFGPEETLDQIQQNIDNQKQKQEFLRMNLTSQMNA